MSVTQARPTFDDRVLQAKIRRLRQVDNHSNLVYLAVEYLCLVAVIGGAVVFAEYRDGVGACVGMERPGLRDGHHSDRRASASACGFGA